MLNATQGGAILETCSQTGATGSRWHHFRALSSCFHSADSGQVVFLESDLISEGWKAGEWHILFLDGA